MFRDIYGAQRIGIKTIFVDSGQGTKTYDEVVPDYFALRFDDVLEGIATLARQRAV